MDKLFRRLTLLVNTPLPKRPNLKHYYIVLTDPVFAQNEEYVAWVSWTSYYDDPDTDTSCFLDVGDHGAINHKSWVDYSRAEIKAVREIKNGLRKGTIEQLNELVREDVYRRILGGLYTSENTDPRVEMFCRQHVCLDRQ